MTTLAEPLTLRSGLTLPNRIAKAAMTENLADRDNQPTPRLAALYRRWAAGGPGLLVTGNLMVDRRFLERSRNVVADELLDLRRLGTLVAATGDVPALAQLNHPGRQCNRMVAWRPVGPSDAPAVTLLRGAFGRPRALRPDEIESIAARFVAAAGRCREAGFDGVQVHAAHGYLLAQFLSPAVNGRSDAWGGDLGGRARLLLDVVRRIRAATGEDFTISVKLNSSDFRHGGFDEDDAAAVAALLDAEGVDLLEVSGGTYESAAILGLAEGQAPTGEDREAYYAAFAARVRAAVDMPVMLTGGIRSRTAMQRLLSAGAADVIGLARPLAVDPRLPARLLDGTADVVDLPTHRVPRFLALAGESEWYERQLARLADGRDFDPRLGPVRAAVEYIGGELVRTLSTRPRRRRLAATAERRRLVTT